MAVRHSLDEVLASPDFQLLTQKQKAFVTRYLVRGMSTGTYDPADAARVAYQVSAKNTASLAVQILNHRVVKRILDFYFGRDPETIDSVLPLLLRTIRKSLRHDLKDGHLTVATIKAVEFYEKRTGEKIDPPTGTVFKVGDHCWQSGTEYIVTAVDADGKPVSADPVETPNAF
jgi:threonine synthase